MQKLSRHEAEKWYNYNVLKQTASPSMEEWLAAPVPLVDKFTHFSCHMCSPLPKEQAEQDSCCLLEGETFVKVLHGYCLYPVQPPSVPRRLPGGARHCGGDLCCSRT